MHKSLDIYDVLPEEMRNYLTMYGFHFNRKAFEMAVKKLRRKDAASGKMLQVVPIPKEKVDEVMTSMNVALEHNNLYDAAYLYNKAKAKFFGSSIADDKHVCLHVKDILDDPAGSDELPFRFWLQEMVALGTPVDWDSLV